MTGYEVRRWESDFESEHLTLPEIAALRHAVTCNDVYRSLAGADKASLSKSTSH